MNDEHRLLEETGELPPQGIRPEKIVLSDEVKIKEAISDFFVKQGLHPMVTLDPVTEDALVIVRTGFRSGFEKHMGDSMRWCVHFALRDLEDALEQYDLHEAANLEIQLLIPYKQFVREDTPAMSEQEGVGDAD